MKKIVLLGGGITSLVLAKELQEIPEVASITLIEKDSTVGGLARTFYLPSGVHYDLGSHRIHPEINSEVLQELRELLKGELLSPPRRGKIKLEDKFIDFPLSLNNLALTLGPRKCLQIFLSRLKQNKLSGNSFKDSMEAKFGSVLYKAFYGPYIEKVWGKPGEELSDIQAKRRVAEGGLWEYLKKILFNRISFFYYPKRGFGEIVEKYSQSLNEKVKVYLNSFPTALICQHNQIIRLNYCERNIFKTFQPDIVISTIPLTELFSLFSPPLPQRVKESASRIYYRALRLFYLFLSQPYFSSCDTYYFPEKEILFNRLSEPKHFSHFGYPHQETLLCLEISCNVGDSLWQIPPAELLKKILSEFQKLSPLLKLEEKKIIDYTEHKLKYAYPVYYLGFEKDLEVLRAYLRKIKNIFTLGRQGLYYHNNLHHSIIMAKALSKFLIAKLRAGEQDYQKGIEKLEAEFQKFKVID
jgi:protoporphyrinogen oxidase